MEDDRDPSISPEYRQEEVQTREWITGDGYQYRTTPIATGRTFIRRDINTGSEFERNESSAPSLEANHIFSNANSCPAGRPFHREHEAAIPPGESSDWTLSAYTFADGSRVKLRLCKRCAGIFWERER